MSSGELFESSIDQELMRIRKSIPAQEPSISSSLWLDFSRCTTIRTALSALNQLRCEHKTEPTQKQVGCSQRQKTPLLLYQIDQYLILTVHTTLGHGS